MQSLPHLGRVQIHAGGCGIGAGRVHPDLLSGYWHPEQVLGEWGESLSQQHLPRGAAAFCPSCPQEHNWPKRGCSQPSRVGPQLTCLQENLSGIRMKELPRSCVMR